MVSLSPANGTILPYGNTPVDVTVRVHYSFASSAGGMVGLVVYPGTGQLQTGASISTDPTSFQVEGQEGETTLHFTVYFNRTAFLPPKGSPITLDFALFPKGITGTGIGFDAQYQLGS